MTADGHQHSDPVGVDGTPVPMAPRHRPTPYPTPGPGPTRAPAPTPLPGPPSSSHSSDSPDRSKYPASPPVGGFYVRAWNSLNAGEWIISVRRGKTHRITATLAEARGLADRLHDLLDEIESKDYTNE